MSTMKLKKIFQTEDDNSLTANCHVTIRYDGGIFDSFQYVTLSKEEWEEIGKFMEWGQTRLRNL